jgi:hypothetical protein
MLVGPDVGGLRLTTLLIGSLLPAALASVGHGSFDSQPLVVNGLQFTRGGDLPLEYPTRPVLAGKILCTSNLDNNRRDNSPNNVGEINPAGPCSARSPAWISP